MRESSVQEVKPVELTDEEAAHIGREFMKALRQNCPDYSWMDCPTEIVVDLLNEIHDLKAAK